MEQRGRRRPFTDLVARTSSHLGQLPDPRGTFKGGFGHHRLGAAGHQATRRSRWSCDRAPRAATPPPIIWSFWSGPHADPGPVALQEGPDPGRRSWLLPRPDHRPFPARPGLLRGLPGDRGRPRRDQARPGLGLAGREQHPRWPAGTRRRDRGDGVAGPEPVVEGLPWDVGDRAPGTTAPRCDPGRLRDATATATTPSPPTRTAGSWRYSEARHRAHTRVEDRIRTGKDTGIGYLPSRHKNINQAARAAPHRAQDAALPTAPGHCSPSPPASPVANARCSFAWPSTGPSQSLHRAYGRSRSLPDSQHHRHAPLIQRSRRHRTARRQPTLRAPPSPDLQDRRGAIHSLTERPGLAARRPGTGF